MIDLNGMELAFIVLVKLRSLCIASRMNTLYWTHDRRKLHRT